MLMIVNLYRDLMKAAAAVDWLGPLALRLYLAPVFFVAGMNKLASFESTVEWFGNPDWGLGLPAPLLLAGMATATEAGGAILLLLGLGTRLITVPLMVTMIVAVTAVHWDNGWQAVHDPMSPYASKYTLGIEAEKAADGVERLDRARTILREHGNYEWLTGRGSFVVSNNGVEWGVTYFVMLLALFFLGGGRYVSLDHYLRRRISA